MLQNNFYILGTFSFSCFEKEQTIYLRSSEFKMLPQFPELHLSQRLFQHLHNN